MSTYSYRLKLAYNGVSFEGWQIQADGHRTVQGELNKILEKMAKEEKVSTLGSGRTDSGVHAVGQVVKVVMALDIEPSALKKGLNSQLPAMIRVLSVERTDENFHPIFSSYWKRYDYVLTDSEILAPSYTGLVTPVSRSIDNAQLNKALKLLIGTFDFERFSTKGTPVKSTIRTIYDAKASIEEWEVSPYPCEKMSITRISIIGDGFLKQMVRLLVGAAMNVATGKATLSEFRHYLNSSSNEKFGPVFPPDGLYLVHVEYDSPYATLH